MLRRPGVLALAWLLAGCTERVVLDDLVLDAGAREVQTSTDGSVVPGIDPQCARNEMVAFTSRAAKLLIALDRSTTMQAAFGGTTREKATVDALLLGLERFQNRIRFGYGQFPPDAADGFPDCHSGCCAGSLRKPNFGNFSPIRDSLKCGESSWDPCPAASYESASNAALDQLRDYYYSRSGSDRDARYVLLVTATEPSCGPLSGNESCTQAVEAADGLGELDVRIMVLSVGYQPPPTSCLARISRAGSSLPPAPADLTNPYVASSPYQLNDYVLDLFSALAETTCTLDLYAVPPAWAQLKVSIDRAELVPVDTSTGNGWSFANSARTIIKLSGTACQQYISSSFSQIYVGYECSKCGGAFACPSL